MDDECDQITLLNMFPATNCLTSDGLYYAYQSAVANKWLSSDRSFEVNAACIHFDWEQIVAIFPRTAFFYSFSPPFGFCISTFTLQEPDFSNSHFFVRVLLFLKTFWKKSMIRRKKNNDSDQRCYSIQTLNVFQPIIPETMSNDIEMPEVTFPEVQFTKQQPGDVINWRLYNFLRPPDNREYQIPPDRPLGFINVIIEPA